MQVAKWGNSLAIRLPAAVVDALQLHEGDNIEITVAGERRFELQRPAGKEELLQRLRRFRGKLPADFHFDRMEANDREASNREANNRKGSKNNVHSKKLSRQ